MGGSDPPLNRWQKPNPSTSPGHTPGFYHATATGTAVHSQRSPTPAHEHATHATYARATLPQSLQRYAHTSSVQNTSSCTALVYETNPHDPLHTSRDVQNSTTRFGTQSGASKRIFLAEWTRKREQQRKPKHAVRIPSFHNQEEKKQWRRSIEGYETHGQHRSKETARGWRVVCKGIRWCKSRRGAKVTL